jgi:hypothetical protein
MYTYTYIYIHMHVFLFYIKYAFDIIYTLVKNIY